MFSLKRVYTASENFFHRLPTRQILKDIQSYILCNGHSVESFFGKNFSLTCCYLFLEDESQSALQNISDAIDSWMEFVRVDPTDLVDDQPFNSIIFSHSVRYFLEKLC